VLVPSLVVTWRAVLQAPAQNEPDVVLALYEALAI
jgi:hypothetical protein